MRLKALTCMVILMACGGPAPLVSNPDETGDSDDSSVSSEPVLPVEQAAPSEPVASSEPAAANEPVTPSEPVAPSEPEPRHVVPGESSFYCFKTTTKEGITETSCYRLEYTCNVQRQAAKEAGLPTTDCSHVTHAYCLRLTSIKAQWIRWRCYDTALGCQEARARFVDLYAKEGITFSPCELSARAPSRRPDLTGRAMFPTR